MADGDAGRCWALIWGRNIVNGIEDVGRFDGQTLLTAFHLSSRPPRPAVPHCSPTISRLKLHARRALPTR